MLLISKKRVENFINFVYFEIIEMMIAVFIWKGFWDLSVDGIAHFLDNSMENAELVSLCIAGLIGYGIYFLLIFYEHLVNRYQNLVCLRVKFIKDLVYLVSFLSVVFVWRFYWEGYDYFVLKSEYKTYIIIATHFASLFVLMLLQVGTILYGPGGLNTSYEDESVDELSGRAYFSINPRLKFFDINFFSKNR